MKCVLDVPSGVSEKFALAVSGLAAPPSTYWLFSKKGLIADIYEKFVGNFTSTSSHIFSRKNIYFPSVLIYFSSEKICFL